VKKYLLIILAAVAVGLMLFIGQFGHRIETRRFILAVAITLAIIVAAHLSAQLRGGSDD
jgi:hypothetical protein